MHVHIKSIHIQFFIRVFFLCMGGRIFGLIEHSQHLTRDEGSLRNLFKRKTACRVFSFYYRFWFTKQGITIGSNIAISPIKRFYIFVSSNGLST